jgi:S1-C subfamily serine protease
LKAGDKIVQIDDSKISDRAGLRDAMSDTGDSTQLIVMRGVEEIVFRVNW